MRLLLILTCHSVFIINVSLILTCHRTPLYTSCLPYEVGEGRVEQGEVVAPVRVDGCPDRDGNPLHHVGCAVVEVLAERGDVHAPLEHKPS